MERRLPFSDPPKGRIELSTLRRLQRVVDNAIFWGFDVAIKDPENENIHPIDFINLLKSERK